MAQKNKSFFVSIVVRFCAYFLFSATVVTAIVLSLDYQKHLFDLSRSQDRESLRLSLTSKSIARDLREIIADLKTVVNLQILEEYLNNENAAVKTRLENSFVNVAENARLYDQIRYIDRTGWEKVRVNFRNGTAFRVPAAQLQNQSRRYYVNGALKLAAGDIYISRLDLSIDHGRIELPYKPVIRVATPVFNKKGDLKGIIVLNYLARQLLDDFRDFMAGSWGEATLVNAWGYWVYSPNEKDEWGFMVKHGNSFAARYPTAWNYIRQHDAGTVTTSSAHFLFATARPYRSDALRELGVVGGKITERYWKLIAQAPLPLLQFSPWTAFKTRSVELLELWSLVGLFSLLLAALRSNYVAKTRALRESENRLAQAQQLAHMGNWVWDMPSATMTWSRESYKIFGLTPQRPIDYEKFIALVHPEDRDAVRKALDDALRRKAPFNIDHRILRADNTLRTVHEQGEVTFGKAGTAVRMFGTVQDITERKAMEEKLRDSEERFRQLAENINEIFWLTEWPQNRIIYVSPAFERIWGIAVQQLYDKPMAWTQAIVNEDREGVAQMFLQCATSGGFDVTYRINRPDGTLRWIHDRAFLIHNKQGEVYRIAGVASDITKRVKTEQELQNYKTHLEELVTDRTAELQASNQELESFNYSLAHDLRTPLRAVTSFSQILSQEVAAKLTAAEQNYLQRITKAGKHMASLLDDISELGRISRSKMIYQKVNLSDIGQQIMKQLQHSQTRREINALVMPAMQCTGDQGLLTIAVRYLLENAWKNTLYCENARIEFGVMSENGETIYYVRDNGIGFNMKHATHLFEPFQHLHDDDEAQGTGISLAAVHRIIQRHKGKVWAVAGENSGASFYFTIPEPRIAPDDKGLPQQALESGLPSTT